MKRLPLPIFKSLELFDACLSEMGTDVERAHYELNRVHIENACLQFAAESTSKTWCNLPRARHGHGECLVAGTLSKSQLKSLYEENVVKSKARAREIYDEIYVAAHGDCPYCGEIGDVETLDHYLPKAYFPSFSVLPANLVPSCNKCNKGTSAAFPFSPDDQPINPYLDDDHFFLERWITAEVLRIDPIVVHFKAEPPKHWSEKDKSRAKQHFIDYGLKLRFGKQVSGEIGPLLSQRKVTLKNLSDEQFREHLSIVANDDNLLLNGWKRTLYFALCKSDWFCKANFNGCWLEA